MVGRFSRSRASTPSSIRIGSAAVAARHFPTPIGWRTVPYGVPGRDDWSRSGEGGTPEPPTPPFTVVCSKHLEPVYGPDLLIRAVASMPGAWRSVLLGDGSARDDLDALAGGGPVACFPSRRESFSVAWSNRRSGPRR